MIVPVIIVLTIVGGIVASKKVEAPELTDSKDPLNKYDGLFQKYGAEYDVPWKILKRMSYIESNIGLNSRVAIGLKDPYNIEGSKSTDGLSWGLMQMTLATARDYDASATAVKLNNPEYAIKLSAQHTKLLIKYFPLNSVNYERNIVMAYNQGQGNQLKFIASEKAGTLNPNSYAGAKNHWAKYEKARGIIS